MRDTLVRDFVRNKGDPTLPPVVIVTASRVGIGSVVVGPGAYLAYGTSCDAASDTGPPGVVPGKRSCARHDFVLGVGRTDGGVSLAVFRGGDAMLGLVLRGLGHGREVRGVGLRHEGRRESVEVRKR